MMCEDNVQNISLFIIEKSSYMNYKLLCGENVQNISYCDGKMYNKYLCEGNVQK